MLSNESFIPDEGECAGTLCQIRWADGITCVDCGSSHVKCQTEIYRDHYCRYECLDCGRWFNGLSERGMKARGRGGYEADHPLVVVWVASDSPSMAIEMCRDAGARTLTTATMEYMVPGSRLGTDTWKGYNWLGQIYDHHTVKHSKEYMTFGGNPCEISSSV